MSNVKTLNPMEEEWDYLLILDACRYDYFEQTYSKFLEGTLEKRQSKGSATPEWLQNTFSDFYDVTYVSANAFVNSHGISVEKYGGFKANNHFSKIIDVWDSGWDPELGTVHPDTVVDEVIEFSPEPRTIIHFVQPHGPYLAVENHFGAEVEKKTPDQFGGANWIIDQRLRPLVVDGLVKLGSLTSRDFIYQIVKRAPVTPSGAGSYAIHYGKERLREIYRENLEIVLRSVTRLLTHLDGKVVITSDHGELLGEDGQYNHPVGSDHPLLKTVPYFHVDKFTSIKYNPYKHPDISNDGTVEDRLRDLGYRV